MIDLSPDRDRLADMLSEWRKRKGRGEVTRVTEASA